MSESKISFKIVTRIKAHHISRECKLRAKAVRAKAMRERAVRGKAKYVTFEGSANYHFIIYLYCECEVSAQSYHSQESYPSESEILFQVRMIVFPMRAIVSPMRNCPVMEIISSVIVKSYPQYEQKSYPRRVQNHIPVVRAKP